jgi:hypothetical protein
MDNWVNTWTPDAPWTKNDHSCADCRFSCNVSIDDEWYVGCAHSLLTGGVDVVETTDDNFCDKWEDEALREGFGGAIYHGKNPVYAVYVDGECLAAGSADDVAKCMGVKRDTVYTSCAPSRRNRNKRIQYVRYYDEDDDA